MKHFFLTLLFFTPITFYSQTIDGFCNLKFGAKQKDVLALNWVKDSIVQQKQGENDLDVFVKHVEFNDKTYDLCIFRFYRGELYGGLMAKLFESKEILLQEVDSLKDAIKIESLDFRNHEDSEIDRFSFQDSTQNELLVEAINEKNLYVLRLHYASSDLSEKKKKEDDKRRIENSIEIEVKDIKSN
ncbi:MAG: hypothetical protein LBL58_18540 [Tannerellaceae bacterium]|jgi:hypothetical protein|nr:hypothetical protein [Tannerellaceae bacterium]